LKTCYFKIFIGQHKLKAYSGVYGTNLAFIYIHQKNELLWFILPF